MMAFDDDLAQATFGFAVTPAEDPAVNGVCDLCGANRFVWRALGWYCNGCGAPALASTQGPRVDDRDPRGDPGCSHGD